VFAARESFSPGFLCIRCPTTYLELKQHSKFSRHAISKIVVLGIVASACAHRCCLGNGDWIHSIPILR
jgi:hypothetical protein